jgi:ribosome-binding factor A
MPSVRVKRVRELIKRQLGEMVRRGLPPEQSVRTSVNDVELTPDLKHATVYVGIVAQQDEQTRILDTLNATRTQYQELLGRAVVLRYTPRLHFKLDTSVERGNRILSILDDIERSSEEPNP